MKNFTEEVLKVFGLLEGDLDYLAELLDKLLIGDAEKDKSLDDAFRAMWNQIDTFKSIILMEVAKYEKD